MICEMSLAGVAATIRPVVREYLTNVGSLMLASTMSYKAGLKVSERVELGVGGVREGINACEGCKYGDPEDWRGK